MKSWLACAALLAACGDGGGITIALEVADDREPDEVFVGNAKLTEDVDENDEPVFLFTGTFDCPADSLVVRAMKDDQPLTTYTYLPFCDCEDATDGALVREFARIEIDVSSNGTVSSGLCNYEGPQ